MVAVFTLGSAQPASADIIVTPIVSNPGTDNVLLAGATDVEIVTGTISSGAFTVNFESTGGNLNADASGQAVISPAHAPFTDISFYLADNALFTKAVFNISSATDGNMLIKVTGVNIGGGAFQESYPVDGNGENFYTVEAISLQYIQAIALIAQGDVFFEDLRQVRIGGAQDVPPIPIPEPASMLLLGGGLAGIGAAAARRRGKNS